MKPKISFIMPQKNRGGRIAKSIQSITSQTYADWELIIVDDHSNPDDKTEDIVAHIGDGRIRYIRMPEKWPPGIPSARNFGNMFAESEIIAVADSDDLSKPYRAERTIEHFSSYNCDIFFGSYEILFENEQRIVEPKIKIEKFSPEMLEDRNYVAHSTSAYKREIAFQFPYNSFFGKGEDYDFFARVAVSGKKFSYCDQVLTQYVVHASNYSGGKKVEVADQLVKVNHYNLSGSRENYVKQFVDEIYN